VLSAAGAILYLYSADGHKRWFNDRKSKCDSASDFEPGRGASVIVGDAKGVPKNPKQHFSAEDITSRTQAPPDQRKASKEGAKGNEVSCTTCFHCVSYLGPVKDCSETMISLNTDQVRRIRKNRVAMALYCPPSNGQPLATKSPI